MLPGAKFELVGHPAVGVADGEYLITQVSHWGSERSENTDRDGLEPYRNRFRCIPLETPYRPARTFDPPRIPGVQTATVTGPSGEEIHVDEHGRIKVQLRWDRVQPADERSSCWVRVEQDWAGAGWGYSWTPRVGMEVVVQFIGGDPDRPLVTGCVYNATHALPYPMPDEKTKSTIKSNSSPGGGGSNELRLEDKAGDEEIYVHAQKDYDEVVEHNHTTKVHNNQRIELDNDQTQTVHKNQKERVDGDQEMSVGGNRTSHVEGDFEEIVDGTEERTVTGNVSETFAANETRTVASSLTESIGGSESRSIGADQTESIGASHSQSIGASSSVTVGGSFAQNVGGAMSTSTPGAINVIAAGGVKVSCPTAIWKSDGPVALISPAGWEFMDGINDWVGTWLVEMEGVGDFSTTGLKIEIGGAAYGVTGAKAALYMVHIDLGASFDEADGVLLATVATDAETGVRLNLAGLTVFG